MRPSVFIIFGITGDLARRKVLPSLYNLAKDGLLPEPTYLVGTSRRPMDAQALKQRLQKQSMPPPANLRIRP